MLSINNALNTFKKRNLIEESFQKLKKNNINQRKIGQFYKNLTQFVRETQQRFLSETFTSILKQGFAKTHKDNLKMKLDRISLDKNCQLNKN